MKVSGRLKRMAAAVAAAVVTAGGLSGAVIAAHRGDALRAVPVHRGSPPAPAQKEWKAPPARTSNMVGQGTGAPPAAGVRAGAASASTIRKGHVKFCAQGNYAAYIKFPHRRGLESTIVPRGHCWYQYMGGKRREPIKVYGIRNTNPSQSFYIGTRWYDGAVSGIGIGAEGVTTRPYLRTW